MTNQEIYDKVLFGLRKQGHASAMYDEHGEFESCAYRGDNGDRCAVGMLIPDEIYNQEIEGLGLYSIVNSEDFCESTPPFTRMRVAMLRQILKESGIKKNQLHFVRELQIAHDDGLNHSTKLFEERMQGIAKEYDLMYQMPEKDAE